MYKSSELDRWNEHRSNMVSIEAIYGRGVVCELNGLPPSLGLYSMNLDSLLAHGQHYRAMTNRIDRTIEMIEEMRADAREMAAILRGERDENLQNGQIEVKEPEAKGKSISDVQENSSVQGLGSEAGSIRADFQAMRESIREMQECIAKMQEMVSRAIELASSS